MNKSFYDNDKQLELDENKEFIQRSKTFVEPFFLKDEIDSGDDTDNSSDGSVKPSQINVHNLDSKVEEEQKGQLSDLDKPFIFHGEDEKGIQKAKQEFKYFLGTRFWGYFSPVWAKASNCGKLNDTKIAYYGFLVMNLLNYVSEYNIYLLLYDKSHSDLEKANKSISEDILGEKKQTYFIDSYMTLKKIIVGYYFLCKRISDGIDKNEVDSESIAKFSESINKSLKAELKKINNNEIEKNLLEAVNYCKNISNNLEGIRLLNGFAYEDFFYHQGMTNLNLQAFYDSEVSHNGVSRYQIYIDMKRSYTYHSSFELAQENSLYSVYSFYNGIDENKIPTKGQLLAWQLLNDTLGRPIADKDKNGDIISWDEDSSNRNKLKQIINTDDSKLTKKEKEIKQKVTDLMNNPEKIKNILTKWKEHADQLKEIKVNGRWKIDQFQFSYIMHTPEDQLTDVQKKFLKEFRLNIENKQENKIIFRDFGVRYKSFFFETGIRDLTEIKSNLELAIDNEKQEAKAKIKEREIEKSLKEIKDFLSEIKSNPNKNNLAEECIAKINSVLNDLNVIMDDKNRYLMAYLKKINDILEETNNNLRNLVKVKKDLPEARENEWKSFEKLRAADMKIRKIKKYIFSEKSFRLGKDLPCAENNLKKSKKLYDDSISKLKHLTKLEKNTKNNLEKSFVIPDIDKLEEQDLLDVCEYDLPSNISDFSKEQLDTEDLEKISTVADLTEIKTDLEKIKNDLVEKDLEKKCLDKIALKLNQLDEIVDIKNRCLAEDLNKIKDNLKKVRNDLESLTKIREDLRKARQISVEDRKKLVIARMDFVRAGSQYNKEYSLVNAVRYNNANNILQAAEKKSDESEKEVKHLEKLEKENKKGLIKAIAILNGEKVEEEILERGEIEYEGLILHQENIAENRTRLGVKRWFGGAIASIIAGSAVGAVASAFATGFLAAAAPYVAFALFLVGIGLAIKALYNMDKNNMNNRNNFIKDLPPIIK